MVGAPARAAGLGGAATVAAGCVAWWLASGVLARWPGLLTTVAVEESLALVVSGAAAALAVWATLLLARATLALAGDAARGRQARGRGGLTGRVTAGLLLAATLGGAQVGAASAVPVSTSSAVPVSTSSALPVSTSSAAPVGTATMQSASAGEDTRATEVPVPGWTPTAAVTTPRTVTVGEVGLVSTAPAEARPAADEVVVVRAGDTLWDIAARALGKHATDQDVAEAWPRWYAANRATIGEDPDLIRPGQQLTVPGEEDDR